MFAKPLAAVPKILGQFRPSTQRAIPPIPKPLPITLHPRQRLDRLQTRCSLRPAKSFVRALLGPE